MAEQIRVGEKLHKKVEKIAKANYRGIKDQIEYWASNDCPHPIEMREPIGHIKFTSPEGKVQVLRVFKCQQCKSNIAIEVEDIELSEREPVAA